MTDGNWMLCPKCEKERIADLEVLREEVRWSYGKVDQDRYLEMVSELEAAKNYKPEYEVGTGEGGEFYIRYYYCCEGYIEHLEQLLWVNIKR